MRHVNGFTLGVLVTLVAFAATLPAATAANDGGGEFGVTVGFTLTDEDIVAEPGADSREGIFGLRGGYFFNDRFGWFVDGLFTEIDAVAALGDEAREWIARTGVDIRLNPAAENPWFVALGGGLTDINYKAGTSDFDYPFASVGVGRVETGERVDFRWELRADRSLDDEGPLDAGLMNLHALGTFVWGGKGQPVDSDGDGVLDRRDDCPDTPRGATVDAKGCPTDSDGDGVFDGIDKCADTPAGWPVDSSGCPKDTDGDGVPDGKDECKKTPRGAKVDAKGCAIDSDGDGVADGIDKCPNTKKGAKVDATGCALDSDGDGVPDGIDQCPNTEKGAKVDATGCALDGDGDGVPDGIDQCPQTPKGVAVDAKGCPADKLFEEGQRTLVLEGVRFETNRAVLTADSRKILDRVVKSLKEWPSVRIEVAGHTDSVGAEDYNLGLSQRRAKAVMDYLVSKGVPAAQLTSKGYGESSPIADNATAAGRAENRRVSLKRLN